MYKPRSIYGVHDLGGAHIGITDGWVLDTVALREEQYRIGPDYGPFVDTGLGVICRLNWGYRPFGTITKPVSALYRGFANACAAYVASSRACHIWVIGNEPNHMQEWPEGIPILPSDYAKCFIKTRDTIRNVSGHEDDEVVVAAVAPWNAQTVYPGNEAGDWLVYFEHILYLLEGKCDGISLHTYTHGPDPHLVYAPTYMGWPYEHRYYDFLAYRDFMDAIPVTMRHLPVYITETDQDTAWHNVNSGWVQRAYGEINWWNEQPGFQKILCLLLYRWYTGHDIWGIEGKDGVVQDFGEALIWNYTWT